MCREQLWTLKPNSCGECNSKRDNGLCEAVLFNDALGPNFHEIENFWVLHSALNNQDPLQFTFVSKALSVCLVWGFGPKTHVYQPKKWKSVFGKKI